MTAMILLREGTALRRAVAEAGGQVGTALGKLLFSPLETKRTGYVFAWFCSVVGGTYLVGQLITIPVVTLLFLRYWGKESWNMAIIQSVVILAFLYFMFGWALNVLWYQSLLDLLL
jgi:hypothetical protein